MKQVLPIIFLFWTLGLYAQDSLVIQPCQACFSYSVNNQVMTLLPATVLDFKDCSTGQINAWYWSFSDGQSSTEKNPTMIFNHPFGPITPEDTLNALITVWLTVVGEEGCKSVYSTVFNKFDPLRPVGNGGETGGDTSDLSDSLNCVAAFKYQVVSIDSINSTTLVRFWNGSVGEDLRFDWKFDDGTSASEIEPVHTYPTSDFLKYVCLKVENDKGCEAFYCDTVRLQQGYNPPVIPVDTGCYVAFSYKTNILVQTFAPALVLDFFLKTDKKIVKCLWDFGDGSSSTDHYPTHVFNLPVTGGENEGDSALYREVCVSVTSATGCEATYCEPIWLSPDDKPEACLASFTYSVYDTTDLSGRQIAYRFKAESNKDIASVSWYFEDGIQRNESEPLVWFDRSVPMQKVALRTTSPEGCTAYYSEVIFIDRLNDTIYSESGCQYIIQLKGDYPIWASACVGTAEARLLTSDSLEVESKFVWSNGIEGPYVKGLCPTQKYGVIAYASDGCKSSASFVFNSDGSVSVIPVQWWVDGTTEGSTVYCDTPDSNLVISWILCDGTVFEGTSIELDKINCGSTQTNLLVKDQAGNVVYSESIGLRIESSSSDVVLPQTELVLYPNPARDHFMIGNQGADLEHCEIQIYDTSGKQLLKKSLGELMAGQETRIDLSGMPGGIYSVRLLSKGRFIMNQKVGKLF